MTQQEERVEKEIKIGHVLLDSGRLWMGDVIHAPQGEERTEHIGYHQAGCGVVVASGPGDGKYPVFVRLNYEGLVADVIVRLRG